MRDLKFSPRTAVEVNFDSSNDVWFPATFLKQVANNFLVEYQESKESELRKATVDFHHIRPIPPSSSHKTFNLLEKVDALCESYWLSGVVTKILSDGRYIVYFKHNKKEKELSHADLRLHLEWNNGKWTQSSQDTTMSEMRGSDGGKNNVASDKTSTKKLRSSQRELQMVGDEKTNQHSTTPTKKRVKLTNGDASQPKTNEERASDVEASNHDTTGVPHFPTPGHQLQSDIKQSEDSGLPSASAEIKGDTEKLSTSGKKGRRQRGLVLGEASEENVVGSPSKSEDSGPPSASVEVKGDNDKLSTSGKKGRKQRGLVLGEASEENVVGSPSKNDVTKFAFGTIVVGLTHDGKMIKRSSKHLTQEHMEAMEGDEKNGDDRENIENGQKKEGEVTNLQKKRGRPPKELSRVGSPRVGSPKTNEAEYLEQEKNSNGKDDERESPITEVDKASGVIKPSGMKQMKKYNNDKMKQRLSDIHNRNMRSNSKEYIRKRKVPTALHMHETLVKKGKKHKSTKQVESQTQDGGDKSKTRTIEDLSKRIDKVNAVVSSNASDDDRPLSAWFEGAVSPDFRTPPSGSIEREEDKSALVVGQVKEQDKLASPSVENIEQVQDGNGTEIVGVQQPRSNAIVSMENQDLPFEKKSLIWELIDNMEIVKRIPQKPHFRPLNNCKEECREGLAIGSMVTFTSLAERISKSKFSDPRNLLDGYLEALNDLEDLGFNVSPLREVLIKLISLKDKHEQAQNTAREIESQIMERNLEMSTINGEMEDLDKKIAELMEKRALVMSKKERKEAEITMLKTSIEAGKGTLENAQEEFEKITSGLW